ncbi:MAG TPA: hypothetical protein VJU86_17680 [Pyrinomonadaceae bacterium]|nr:hypothetical protein [Pyrinomonadaceae bacterium]
MALITLLPVAWVRGQCVDSSEVNGFKVRAVKVKTLFGGVPKELRRILDGHRNESYSADRASQYIHEIRAFYSSDPAQAKYERLIANKLKLSIKAGRTGLDCVEKVTSDNCVNCVDVTIKRYFIDIDALDSSPYLLLFPRTALAAFYGAMPKPLLALNPGLNARHDKRIGPAGSIDTATDLLDLGSILAPNAEPTAEAPMAPVTPVAQPASSPDDSIEITVPGGAGNPVAPTGTSEEPPVELESRDTKLLLTLRGWQGITKDYYDTSSGLALERTQARGLFQNLALNARFDARKLPLGNGDAFRNALFAGFDTDLRLGSKPFKLLNMGGRYRWSRNRFISADGSLPNEASTESGFEGRALADGNLAGGLIRAALWFDGARRDRNLGSYSRAAMTFGYGKELILRRKKHFHEISPPELAESCWTSYPDSSKPDEKIKNESTLGIDLIAGAGRTWGDVPEYARFYGGRPAGQFLYDELNAEDLTTFPFGPALRSLGQNQAGVVRSPTNPISGGTSYWHANVSVSIPVTAWSRPLIPHEWVTSSPKRPGDEEFDGHVPDGANICRDLKSTIKTLVGVSGVNLMVNQQARDLLTEEQKKDLRLRNVEPRTPEQQARLDAAEQALTAAKTRLRPEIEGLFAGEILPITNFIADHANIIAVKPLVMFDVAHLSDARVSSTRYGLGGGLQIDVVLARFELGYMATLRPEPGDAKGSFVGRLILKRLF